MSVSDDMAGKRRKCPHCKNKITVPRANAGPTIKKQEQVDSAPHQPTQPNREPPKMLTVSGIPCTHCGRQVGFNPSLAGQTVNCPHCGGRFEMLANSSSSPLPLATLAPPPINVNVETPRQNGPASGPGMAAAGLVIGILSLLLVCIPCVNFAVPLLAFLGIIFSGTGLVLSSYTRQGREISIFGLLLSVLAFISPIVIVLALFFKVIPLPDVLKDLPAAVKKGINANDDPPPKKTTVQPNKIG